jgi:hypothetical protein
MDINKLSELSQAYKTARLAKFEAWRKDDDDNYVNSKEVRRLAAEAVETASEAYDIEFDRQIADGVTQDEAKQLMAFNVQAKRYL